MKRILLPALILLLCVQGGRAAERSGPNILFAIADDWGRTLARMVLLGSHTFL